MDGRACVPLCHWGEVGVLSTPEACTSVTEVTGPRLGGRDRRSDREGEGRAPDRSSGGGARKGEGPGGSYPARTPVCPKVDPFVSSRSRGVRELYPWVAPPDGPEIRGRTSRRHHCAGPQLGADTKGGCLPPSLRPDPDLDPTHPDPVHRVSTDLSPVPTRPWGWCRKRSRPSRRVVVRVGRSGGIRSDPRSPTSPTDVSFRLMDVRRPVRRFPVGPNFVPWSHTCTPTDPSLSPVIHVLSRDPSPHPPERLYLRLDLSTLNEEEVGLVPTLRSFTGRTRPPFPGETGGVGTPP